MLRNDDVVPAIEEGVAEKLDYFIRTVPEDGVIPGATKAGRKRFAQIITASIRIEMRRVQSATNRRQRFWRRTKRVLIRGEFDDLAGVHTKLARGFLDRLAWLVHGQIAQLRIGDIPHG